jgi:hypothetical protein
MLDLDILDEQEVIQESLNDCRKWCKTASTEKLQDTLKNATGAAKAIIESELEHRK